MIRDFLVCSICGKMFSFDKILIYFMNKENGCVKICQNCVIDSLKYIEAEKEIKNDKACK